MDKNNVISVLEYIKTEYGIDCFNGNKFINMLADIVPEFKKPRIIFLKLHKAGLIKELYDNRSSSSGIQQRIANKAIYFLIADLVKCIRL